MNEKYEARAGKLKYIVLCFPATEIPMFVCVFLFSFEFPTLEVSLI